MNKYEIFWGDKTFYKKAENPYKACIELVQENAENLIHAPFKVFTIDSWNYAQKALNIGLAEILGLKSLSDNYDETLLLN